MAREGLERLDGVASVDEDPDLTNRTARIYPKKGRWLAPNQIAEHLKNLGIGATLRGVEATIEGTIEQEGGNLYLRVGRSSRRLKLGPLTVKIQQDPLTKTARPPSAAEKNALAKLLDHVQRYPTKPVRVTGVLKCDPDTRLELRQFAESVAARKDRLKG